MYRALKSHIPLSKPWYEKPPTMMGVQFATKQLLNAEYQFFRKFLFFYNQIKNLLGHGFIFEKKNQCRITHT